MKTVGELETILDKTQELISLTIELEDITKLCEHMKAHSIPKLKTSMLEGPLMCDFHFDVNALTDLKFELVEEIESKMITLNSMVSL